MENYSLQTAGAITTTPKAPREPTREMALALRGEQTTVCMRGTFSDEAGALPINITVTTEPSILVVRMESGAMKSERNFLLRIYAPIGEQVVTGWTVASQGFVAPLFFVLVTVPVKGTCRERCANTHTRRAKAYSNNQTAAPTAAQKSTAANTTMTMAESTPYTVLDRAIGGTLSE